MLLGEHQFALELKYLCKGLIARLDGEGVILRHQGAHHRYDVCEDILRREHCGKRRGYQAAVLVLANEPAYWQTRHRPDTVDAAFDIADCLFLGGNLRWGAAAGLGHDQGPRSIRKNFR